MYLKIALALQAVSVKAINTALFLQDRAIKALESYKNQATRALVVKQREAQHTVRLAREHLADAHEKANAVDADCRAKFKELESLKLNPW